MHSIHPRHFLAGMLMAAALAGQRQDYPEGSAIGAGLTPRERAWIANHPLHNSTLVPTPPPTGPVHCAAEYEPMDGVLFAWEGPSSWTAIVAQMARHVTTTGNAKAYVTVDDTTERNNVTLALQAAGCNMSRVEFVVRPTDTIWIRDYGPRYIFEGDCRAVVDHTYNRPRPNDDLLPQFFASQRGHGFYEHALVHGGGNYHLDALNRAYATRLINNENPGLSEAQIVQIWRDYQNVNTTLFTPFPISVDLTQHLDMWMQVTADQAVMISDWPNDSGSAQDQICDSTAAVMQGRGYMVHRVPARSIGGTHYTYTNVVMCNDIVLIPQYTNTIVAPHNAQALAAWQAALPNKTIVQINAEALVVYAGVLHCIVMHVPKHRGGLTPTAYLRSPNGGEQLTPNQSVTISYLTDDDERVASVDLLLSTNDGQSYPWVLASGVPASGRFTWTVPDLDGRRCKLRVVARDEAGRIGQDDSDASFVILGTGCRAANVGYGQGKAGRQGVPLLIGNSPPVLGSQWTVALSSALGNAPAILLVGGQRLNVPFDGGVILANPDVLFGFVTDGSGASAFPFTVPDQPQLCGLPVFLQVWVPNDPGASGLGFACSAGLQGVLGI